MLGPAPARFDPNPRKDLSLPGVDDNLIRSGLLRLTWQVDTKNKFSAYLDKIFKERFHEHDATEDVATASTHWQSPSYYTASAKWTSTLSSRLLIEGGYSSNVENWTAEYQDDEPPFGPAGPIRQVRPPTCDPASSRHVSTPTPTSSATSIRGTRSPRDGT